MSHSKEEEETETYKEIVEGIKMTLESLTKKDYASAEKRLRYILEEQLKS